MWQVEHCTSVQGPSSVPGLTLPAGPLGMGSETYVNNSDGHGAGVSASVLSCPLQGTRMGTEGKEPFRTHKGAQGVCVLGPAEAPHPLAAGLAPPVRSLCQTLWSVSLEGQQGPTLGGKSWGAAGVSSNDSHLRERHSVIKLLPPPTAGNSETPRDKVRTWVQKERKGSTGGLVPPWVEAKGKPEAPRGPAH